METKISEKPQRNLPRVVDQFDAARLEINSLKAEILRLREENSRLSQTVLKYEDASLHSELKVKYSLGEGDRIDLQSMNIVRNK